MNEDDDHQICHVVHSSLLCTQNFKSLVIFPNPKWPSFQEYNATLVTSNINNGTTGYLFFCITAKIEPTKWKKKYVKYLTVDAVMSRYTYILEDISNTFWFLYHTYTGKFWLLLVFTSYLPLQRVFVGKVGMSPDLWVSNYSWSVVFGLIHCTVRLIVSYRMYKVGMVASKFLECNAELMITVCL